LAKQFKESAAAKPEHDKLAADVAQAVGVKPKYSILKYVSRTAEKVAGKGKDKMADLKDISRSTLVADNYSQAQKALETLEKLAKERFGDDSVVSTTNTIDHNTVRLDPKESGYRDIKVIVKINGQPTEFQINTPEMMRAKSIETPIYERRRAIRDRAKAENRALTPEEQKKGDALTERSKKIYQNAIDKIEARAGDKSQ
jgi:hypothetical protein